MASRYANDIEIAKAQRDFELKKAAYDMEVSAKESTEWPVSRTSGMSQMDR